MPRDAAELINDDLGGMTVHCDGWARDFAWLALLFEAAGLSPRFKLESVHRLLSESQLLRLDEVRRHPQAEMGLTRHRASNDARALQAALLRISAQASAFARPWPARAPATGAT